MSAPLGCVLQEARNSSASQLGESELGLKGGQAPLSSTRMDSHPPALFLSLT